MVEGYTTDSMELRNGEATNKLAVNLRDMKTVKLSKNYFCWFETKCLLIGLYYYAGSHNSIGGDNKL